MGAGDVVKVPALQRSPSDAVLHHALVPAQRSGRHARYHRRLNNRSTCLISNLRAPYDSNLGGILIALRAQQLVGESHH